MALITLPWIYVPNKDKFGTYFDAKIYVGAPDNPNPRTSQKDTRLVQEDGTTVIAQQPIRTNAGGIPIYNGSVVALDVDGDYSLAIDDSTDQQKYYFANIGTSENFITTDLRAIMFDLGLTYGDIGVKLITESVGNSLNNAEYILNTETGEVWNLGNRIPSGATVVSLTGDNLVTSLGSFTLEAKQSDITQNVENLIKGNQNWNVAGVDGSLTSSPQAFVAGNEFTFGWKVASGSSLPDIVRIDGETTAPSGGIVEYIYTQDEAEQVNENDTLFSVTNKLGLQTYAAGLATNGLKIDSTTVLGEVKLSIDFSVYTNGISYLTLSNKLGQAQPINDKESEQATFNVKCLDFNKFVHVQDKRASGTSGGPSIVGIQQRELNTEVTNTLGATLASNNLTLEAGRYYCEASAPANQNNGHQIVVAKSDNTILLRGSSLYGVNTVAGNTESVAKGVFFLDSTTDVIIRHYISVARSTDGLGRPSSNGSGFEEVYTNFLVWKISND